MNKELLAGVVATSLTAFFCSVVYVGAESLSKISIPVSYEVNDTVESTFTLQGINGAPMPEGSEGDRKTVQRNNSGSVDFGEITFTTPDLYRYTISKTTEDRNAEDFIKSSILNTFLNTYR